VKALLVHPEDSPRRGPWAGERWDLLVDLGRSSEPQVCAWKKEFGCDVLPLDTLRRGHDDLRAVREILFAGRGHVMDSAGLDWWELNGIEFHAELEQALLLGRLASELKIADELHITRCCWQSDALRTLGDGEIRAFGGRPEKRLLALPKALRRLSLAQMLEIALDKHDPEYKWRRRVAQSRGPAAVAQVVVPTAYINVTRMAAEYARLLPNQPFLLAVTRSSAVDLDLPPNMKAVGLWQYAQASENVAEHDRLLQSWHRLRAELEDSLEMRLLAALGRLERFAPLLRSGLAVRNAWQALLVKEPVAAVLCGDDSNPPTRIPVMLARRCGLPTADFHHGALDGRFVFKSLPADCYLAKSEIESDYLARISGLEPEKIVIAAPGNKAPSASQGTRLPADIVFFSEPYEIGGTRAEEVYREVLPPLADLARKQGLQLTVKLHPFESLRERRRLIHQTVPPAPPPVNVIANVPLADVLHAAWCGVTVESSTVLDCARFGVPAFLCGWRALSPFGYTRQYARFGVGHMLCVPAEIAGIPDLIAGQAVSSCHAGRWQQASPELLAAVLSGQSMAAQRPD
jgi:hypothetical protein